MPHELFLTKRQKTKIRNTLTKNMSIDIKLSKAQLSKIILSGEFLDNMIGNLGKKALLDLAVPLAKDVLSKLATNLATKVTLSILDKFKRKMYSLFISNENMNDIIKIVESKSKHKKMRKKADFLAL